MFFLRATNGSRRTRAACGERRIATDTGRVEGGREGEDGVTEGGGSGGREGRGMAWVELKERGGSGGQ